MNILNFHDENAASFTIPSFDDYVKLKNQNINLKKLLDELKVSCFITVDGSFKSSIGRNLPRKRRA